MVTERVKDTIAVTILFFVVTVVGAQVGDFTQVDTVTFLQLKWWVSGIWNLAGVILAIRYAGFFGLVGYYFEYVGAAVLLDTLDVGLFWMFVGASIIVVGRPSWQAFKNFWAEM